MASQFHSGLAARATVLQRPGAPAIGPDLRFGGTGSGSWPPLRAASARPSQSPASGPTFPRGAQTSATGPTSSIHEETILKYPDGQLFITNGQGLMAGYRWPMPPADSWAIVAYGRDPEREPLASAKGAPADGD